MIDYSLIGSRIRQYRIERGITQEDLAFQISTSTAYISSIERGIKKPSLRKLTEISEVLHVTVNDLIYSSPDASYSSFDRSFQYIMKMCTPEKQKRITKSIAEIIYTIVNE